MPAIEAIGALLSHLHPHTLMVPLALPRGRGRDAFALLVVRRLLPFVHWLQAVSLIAGCVERASPRAPSSSSIYRLESTRRRRSCSSSARMVVPSAGEEHTAPVKLECGHIFCEECITSWCERNTQRPAHCAERRLARCSGSTATARRRCCRRFSEFEKLAKWRDLADYGVSA